MDAHLDMNAHRSLLHHATDDLCRGACWAANWHVACGIYTSMLHVCAPLLQAGMAVWHMRLAATSDTTDAMPPVVSICVQYKPGQCITVAVNALEATSQP